MQLFELREQIICKQHGDCDLHVYVNAVHVNVQKRFFIHQMTMNIKAKRRKQKTKKRTNRLLI